MSTVPPDVVKDFAPTGTLRVAINLGNSVLAQTDKTTGKPRGIIVDLAGELGRRLGLTPQLHHLRCRRQGVRGAQGDGAWDVAFLAVEPARAAEIAFTAPYVIIEGVYMVPKDSAAAHGRRRRSRGRAHRGRDGSAYDLYLSRTLKHAQLVRAPTGNAAMEMFVADKLEVSAGVRQPIVAFASRNPNLRVIEGRFMEIEQAMGMPKGRDTAVRYLRSFVEEMKAQGFVADALKRNNKPDDALVAPPA